MDLKDLTVFQGDLKSLSKKNYTKLKKEILELGYSSPIHFWVHNGKNYILDGTQRFRTLTEMTKEGIPVPTLPMVKVEADSINEAKRKVLALTSQYGQMEKEGLYEFMSDSDLTVDEIAESFRFPEIDLKDFNEEFFGEPEPEEEPAGVKEKSEWLVVCECSGEAEQAALYEQLESQGVKCKVI